MLCFLSVGNTFYMGKHLKKTLVFICRLMVYYGGFVYVGDGDLLFCEGVSIARIYCFVLILRLDTFYVFNLVLIQYLAYKKNHVMLFLIAL